MSRTVDWNIIDHFIPSEFDPNEVQYISHDLIARLDVLRGQVGGIHPSRAKGAWARFDGSKTSGHYAVDRLSTAGDIFTQASARVAVFKAIECGFGGIGIYEGTRNNRGEPQTMLHVDLRDNLTLWARDANGEYWYPQRGGDHERKFFEVLARC